MYMWVVLMDTMVAVQQEPILVATKPMAVLAVAPLISELVEPH